MRKPDQKERPDLRKVQVIYEDNHLIVINKLPGQIVQGDKTGDVSLMDLVKDYIKKKYNKPGAVYLGLVHRLDRPTSGIVVFAKTSKAASRLSEMFRKKDIKKTYWAITKERPLDGVGRLTHYLRKNEEKNKSVAKKKPTRGYKEAILDFEMRSASDNFCLIEVKLITGRHHQIRCQLSAIGAPIKGDIKYGAKRTNRDGSISLHSRHISFVHPVKKEPVSFTAPVVEDELWKYFEKEVG
ncbi:RluA family pseudouridine synthase [bacterium SCSIO 12643]|nr:RluA family pseudouridine synthase [bacterium SCSIO 12643]